MNPAIERLREIKTLPQLVAYLRDELNWPIGSDDADAVTFEYSREELGLDAKHLADIKEIRQLRPLSADQPWGIFFVNFEKKRLPVTIMRLILAALRIKKRTPAERAGHQAWQPRDLLFISAYGEEGDRALTFAHFVPTNTGTKTAELRVLGWDDDDTPLKYEYIVDTLNRRLRWRDEFARNAESWRRQWSEAFVLRHRQVITTSKQLALALAAAAKRIRARVRSLLRFEDGFGEMRRLLRAFQTALIHDLSDDDFADMVAQTITYGLFSVSVRRTVPGEGTAVTREDPLHYIYTSSFLKEMMTTFLGIKSRKGKIDFDRLGIADVTDLLQSKDTDMVAVLWDFGNRSPGEDPVIHFYQDFLRAYDPEKRIKRGVFYTPQPVVSYIVRSVHEFLQSEFKLADGLADTSTWGEMMRRTPGLKLPNISGDPERYQPIDESEPFVQILDPAVGTATFLVEAIDVICRHLKTKWDARGFKEMPELPATSFPRQPADFSEYWNQYVAFSLLPRLHGFELMMAPYAIAHMKIGLKLWATGYRFGADERAHIYLTNSLEPPSDIQRDLPTLSPALAHEAQAVNEVKRRKRFTIVIGNPPYSKISANLGDDAVRLIDPFRFVGGDRIVERGALALELNLQDDYVKFWGLLRKCLLATEVGVGAYITNSRYLASPTLRGLRWNLKELFDRAAFLNLGGQVSERFRDGRIDENVFDIEQGVAIGVGRRGGPHVAAQSATYGRFVGTRSEKYAALDSATIRLLTDIISIEPPYFRFSRGVDLAEGEFSVWPELPEIMPFNSGAIITSRDNLAIDFDRSVLLAKIDRFASSAKGDRQIEEEIGYSVKAKWDVEACKRSIRNNRDRRKCVHKILYRPFDERFIFYSTALLDTPSKPVSDSIFGCDNLVLLTPKVKTSETFNHALISRLTAEKKACSHDRATQMFPLYRCDSDLTTEREPNLHGFPILGQNSDSAQACCAYIYAILYSPTYRERYGNAIRDGYPRIPTSPQLELFRALAKLGGELVALHLLESPKLDKPRTEFIGSNRTVEKVSYSKNTVWIDKAQTTGFRRVPEEVWNFHIGGYQVCEKWLKDRKGRTLSKDDIAHYHKIVVALSETIRLMSEIDKVIEKHGGWPEAFQPTKQTAK